MAKSKRKKPIAYVLRRFPKISETFVLNEILAIEAQGIPVVIFALMPTRDPRFHEGLSKLKANIYYLPNISEWRMLLRHNVRAARRNGKRYFRAFLYALGTLRPSLVWRFLQSGYIADKAQQLHVNHLHAHFATRATSAALLTSRITNVPYSFTAHAVDIYKTSVKREALENKIAAAKFVITVSDCNKAYLQQLANGEAQRIVRIYNGIDMDRFKPGGTPRRLQTSESARFTILTVARLVEKKGLIDLVKACAHMAQRNVPYQCVIIGKGRLRSKLNETIKETGLHDRVRILRPHTQAEIAERYRSANLFVLPCTVATDGNRDGLPVSIVEALASGLPVVSTAVTGIPEVVKHGHNGLIVPERDPAALADAIESLISDDDLYRNLCAHARDSVLSQFNLHATAAELKQLFEAYAA